MLSTTLLVFTLLSVLLSSSARLLWIAILLTASEYEMSSFVLITTTFLASWSFAHPLYEAGCGPLQFGQSALFWSR